MKRARHSFSIFLYTACAAASAITFLFFVSIVGYIMVKGIPQIKLSLFSPTYTEDNLSMLPALINTLLLTLFSMLVTIPVSIASAVYLTEYSNSQSLTVKLITASIETLASMPSIVYGLFGYLCFAVRLKWGFSFLAGAATASLMTLPIMISSSRAVLISVPPTIKEGSFALGAGRATTVFRLMLPAAKRGIAAGAVLSIGRIISETAALIYTSGSSAEIVTGILTPGRTLAVHIYALCCEGLYIDRAYASSAVLLMAVILINAAANIAAQKISGATDER